MRFFFVFLFILTELLAEPSFTVVTENEPSSLVEGVSVITGDFYLWTHVYTVQGAEPIEFSSTYISEGIHLCGHEYSTAEHAPTFSSIYIREPRGAMITYSTECSEIAIDKNDPAIYTTSRFIHDSLGITNTASGDLSARTHLKNQRIIFDPKINSQTTDFAFYASDGTVRAYGRRKGQNKLENPCAPPSNSNKNYLSYKYFLLQEELPNGHIIRYYWNNDTLSEIHSTNKSGDKIFAKLRLNESSEFVEIIGTDGQRGTARTKFLKEGKKSVLENISSPDQPDLCFRWIAKQMVISDKPRQRTYLSSISMGGEKTLHIHYYLGDKHTKPKVYQIQAPVGKDAKPLTTNRFVYHGNSTDVFDIDGNKTTYCWNDKSRLTSIRRFSGNEVLYNEERFAWDDTLLVSRSFWDAKGVCKSARSFDYDEYANVAASFFSGNLTGNGGNVILKANGAIEQSGIESHIIKTSYSNDGKHLPLRSEEPSGLVTLYTYVPGTNLVKTKTLCDHENPTIQYTYDYDEDYLLIQETIDDGISYKIKRIYPKQTQPYIGMPEVIEEKYLENGKEVLLKKRALFYTNGARIDHEDIYDANDIFQYRLSYAYDEKNHVISETNALGQTRSAKYDASGNRYFYQDFGSLTTEHSEFDFSNRLIRKVSKDPDKERIYEYSYGTKNELEWESDERGHKTFYTYDFLNRPIEIVEPAFITDQKKAISPITKRSYDIFGNETLRIDPEGHETTTEYNAYGKPVHITHPDGTEEHFIYNLKGSLESHIDTNGIKTTYKRDYLDRVVEKVIFQNDYSLSKETFEYTGYLLTSQTDAEGNITTYQYDKAGRKISETFAGETVTYAYDELGRPFKTQEGAEITYKVYDLLNRVIEERQEALSGELLQKVLYEYNEQGDQTAITRFINGSPSKETFVYDSLHRVIQKTNPLGYIETTTYNDVTNVYNQKVLQKIHTDALGLQTIETFDPQGNLQQIEKRKGKTLALTEKFYTPSRKVSLQIDTIFAPDGSQRKVSTRWEYDAIGREITVIEAADTSEEKITRKTYAPTGELKTLTKPDQTVISYTYNGLKQLISIDASDDSVHHTMSYNRLGHLQTTDHIKRIIDPKGRVLSEVFFDQYSIENAFDKYGRKTSLQITPVDTSVIYDYLGNSLRRVSRLSGSAELYSHEYLERDASRKVLKERLIDGESLKTQVFDLLSRKILTASPFFEQKIGAFDAVGNILAMTRQKETRNYAYDDLYQLTEETGLFAHAYSYDSMRNRLTKDEELYKINALNQATSHFVYNANGCPIQGENISFAYDALDRLIKIAAPTFTKHFTYDSQHRCLSKTTCRQNEETTQYFLYDGQKEIGSLDDIFVLKELRVLGEILHAELSAAIAIELDGKIFIPLHDLQSNISTLIPLDNSAITQYDYSAFGEETQQGPIATPWSFSSKRSDRETGLIYYGRRFYTPALGRWLTPDPAGFTDGMNLYAFVKNEPLMHFDEYGLLQKSSHPFSASDAFDQLKYDAARVWNHPYCQGGMQMMAGAGMMVKGMALLPTPAFLAGAISLGYGIDLFTTGLDGFVYGTDRPTVTRNILEEKIGLPSLAATFAESFIGPKRAPRSSGSYQISKFGSNTGNLGKLPNTPKYKPFTKDYYRENLKILTGKNPPRYIDAHHVLPQQFRDRFLQRGINIDDPKYLVWWESKLHRPTAKEYNAVWSKFFRDYLNPTPDQILKEGKKLMKEYGIDVNY